MRISFLQHKLASSPKSGHSKSLLQPFKGNFKQIPLFFGCLLILVIFLLNLFLPTASYNPGEYCDAGDPLSWALGSHYYMDALIMSFALLFPMVIDVALDSVGPKELCQCLSIRWTLLCAHLIPDIVIFLYVIAARDIQTFFSLILIRDMILVVAVVDYVQVRSPGPNGQSTQLSSSFFSMAVCAFTFSFQITRFVTGFVFANPNSVGGAIGLLCVLASLLCQAHYVAVQVNHHLHDSKKKHQRMSPDELSRFVQSVALFMSTLGSVVLFIIFGPVRICDLKLEYLLAKTFLWTFLSLVVSFMNGRRAKLEVTDKTQSLQMKRMFVRYVSHEIRTPLNILSTGLGLVQSIRDSFEAEEKDCSNDDNYEKLLQLVRDIFTMTDEMKDSCDTAVNILNDLLLYEKIEGGILQVEKKEENIRPIVEDTVKAFAVQARGAGLTLDLKFDSEIDDIGKFEPTNGANDESSIVEDANDQVVFVNVDKPKICQVIRNLVSNAIKFSRRGGAVEVNVSIRCSRFTSEKCSMSPTIDPAFENKSVSLRSHLSDALTDINLGLKRFVRISVTDSGVGLSAENQTKLFNQIIQFSPNELQGGGGSGLGLYISKGIVNAHGGRIGVYSRGEGFGSTFFVEIPVYERLHLASKSDCDDVGLHSVECTKRDVSHTSVSSHSKILGMHLAAITKYVVRAGDSFHRRQTSSHVSTTPKPSVQVNASSPQRVRYRHEVARVHVTGFEDAPIKMTTSGSPEKSDLLPLHQKRSLQPGGAVDYESSFSQDQQSRTSSQVFVRSQTQSPTSSIHKPCARLSPLTGPDTTEDYGHTDPRLSCAGSPNVQSYASIHENGPYVLVVDDSAANRKMLVRLLHAHHIQTEEAESGLEAVQMIAKILGKTLLTITPLHSARRSSDSSSSHPNSLRLSEDRTSVGYGCTFDIFTQASLDKLPDAIIMDFVMPTMDGPTATRYIRKLGYSGIIIGATGKVLQEEIDLFKRKGADLVLPKPLDPVSLLQAIGCNQDITPPDQTSVRRSSLQDRNKAQRATFPCPSNEMLAEMCAQLPLRPFLNELALEEKQTAISLFTDSRGSDGGPFPAEVTRRSAGSPTADTSGVFFTQLPPLGCLPENNAVREDATPSLTQPPLTAATTSVENCGKHNLPAQGLSCNQSISEVVSSQKRLQEKAFSVLVVDDSTPNRKMLIRLLRMHKICDNPSEAEDGQLAVDFVAEAMRSSSFMDIVDSKGSYKKTVAPSAAAAPPPIYSGGPDAILMDFVMPNMDGPTATRRIRDLGYTGKIVGITGNALPNDVSYFKEMGADEVLTKPVEPTELSKILKNRKI